MTSTTVFVEAPSTQNKNPLRHNPFAQLPKVLEEAAAKPKPSSARPAPPPKPKTQPKQAPPPKAKPLPKRAKEVSLRDIPVGTDLMLAHFLIQCWMMLRDDDLTFEEEERKRLRTGAFWADMNQNEWHINVLIQLSKRTGEPVIEVNEDFRPEELVTAGMRHLRDLKKNGFGRFVDAAAEALASGLVTHERVQEFPEATRIIAAAKLLNDKK